MVLHPLLQPEEANQRVRVFAMIETAEAIKNIDSILDVPGLDGIFVGNIKSVCTVQFVNSRNFGQSGNDKLVLHNMLP